MKSAIEHRLALLESAALQRRLARSERITCQSFAKQVETRMRLKRESLEVASQALAVHLEDDELDALLAQAGVLEEDSSDWESQ